VLEEFVEGIDIIESIGGKGSEIHIEAKIFVKFIESLNAGDSHSDLMDISRINGNIERKDGPFLISSGNLEEAVSIDKAAGASIVSPLSIRVSEKSSMVAVILTMETARAWLLMASWRAGRWDGTPIHS